MTIFSRLTFSVTLLAAAAWAFAAPPRVTGNRPVVIDVPVPDADPPAADPAEAQSREGRNLAALLQPEHDTAAGEKVPTPASELKRAREQLLKASSVSATVVETVTLFDRSYKAEGKYLQRTAPRPNEWNMRLELRIKIGESAGSLLEVCDGEVLWTRTDIDFGKKRERREKKETTLTRRNVAEIMSAARKLGDPKNETTLIASFGLGGLPALIAAIEQDMKFNAEMKQETLRERPVTVVSGVWTETFAAKLRGQGAAGAPSLLPAFVPDAVRLYIDRESGFPHRVMYLKKLPGRKVSRALLTLDFLDVALNEPINNSEFDYEPPANVTPIEQTKGFVDMLTPSDSKTQSGAPPR
jgi:outer membrane lipoprotein-sorting protein